MRHIRPITAPVLDGRCSYCGTALSPQSSAVGPADVELIPEFNSIAAAIIFNRIPVSQLRVIYAIIGSRSLNYHELASRWGVELVITTDDWARAQLRRRPMFRPKGHAIRFASDLPAVQ